MYRQKKQSDEEPRKSRVVFLAGIQYTLGGGNSSSTGRVEIHYDGKVSGVCSLHWAYNDSHVLCRSMGFQDGIPTQPPPVDGGPAPLDNYLLNAVFCKGTEPSIMACLNSGFNSSYLSHSCIGEAHASCYNHNVCVSLLEFLSWRHRREAGNF